MSFARGIGTALLVCGTLAAGMAEAGIEPGSWFTADTEVGAGVVVRLLVVPDGSGASLTAARTSTGQVVDATIYLRYYDESGNPIAGLPVEDMWLESLDGGLTVCLGGAGPDHPTDANGTTTWTAPLRAGGWSDAGCQVVLNGWTVAEARLPQIHFVSPDLDGNLRVDLADLPHFVADWSTQALRSDLCADGVVDLTDLVVLAQSAGRHCP